MEQIVRLGETKQNKCRNLLTLVSSDFLSFYNPAEHQNIKTDMS